MENRKRLKSELLEEVSLLRRQVAELEESMLRQAAHEAERSDFYAMVTHDIKTPLTAIIAYAELLRSAEGIDGEALAITDAIMKNGERLHKLMDDFLMHSRLESGAAPMDMKPEDPVSLIREVGFEFRVQAEKKGLSLDASAGPGLPPVMVDRLYLTRALYNLVQNAVNYTPPGGNILLDASRHDEADRTNIVISVSDDGPGIPEGEQDKVFKKYYRLPGNAGVSGSGLGLPIVKAVAEAHGGKVELESGSGRGSVFRIILPACPGE